MDAREAPSSAAARLRPAAATARAAARRRDPVRVAAEDLDDLLLGQPGVRAVRSESSSDCGCAVGVVGRVEDLLGRHEVEEAQQVDGLHTEVSKKTPGVPAKWPARPQRSAIPACAMISCASGYVSTRRAGYRRSAAARARRGSGSGPAARPRSRRPARGARRSSTNFCARGWSLIPRAPRSRQRSASSIGLSLRSSRTKGMNRPSDAPRTRAYGRFPRGTRVPVGLVEAEHVAREIP